METELILADSPDDSNYGYMVHTDPKTREKEIVVTIESLITEDDEAATKEVV